MAGSPAHIRSAGQHCVRHRLRAASRVTAATTPIAQTNPPQAGCPESSVSILSCQVSSQCWMIKVASPKYLNVLRTRRLFSTAATVEGGESLHRALIILPRLDQLGIVPSHDVYLALLKICKQRKALPQAKQVYAHLTQHAIDHTGLVGEHLVVTLANCGGVNEAHCIFSQLSNRPASTWIAMVSAYLECGKVEEALIMYEQMREDSADVDYHTFVKLLKACGDVGNLAEAKKLDDDSRRMGFFSDAIVGSSLVNMFAKSGSVMDAENVFSRLPQRNVVTWNVMMSAYAEHPEKALQLYKQMKGEGKTPNKRTFVILLHACCSLAEKEEGVGMPVPPQNDVGLLAICQALHADARRKGYVSQVFIGSALVSLYGKCGRIAEAENVFSELSEHDVVSWTAMLRACVEQGEGKKALWLYKQMQVEGLSPNQWTFVISLQACCSLVAEKVVEVGREEKVMPSEIGMALHDDVRRKHFDCEVFVASILITMYGKCGRTEVAEDIFCCLVGRDIVTWNAMLSLYVEGDEGEKALWLYRQMREEGFCPNKLTFVISLQACCLLAEKEEAFSVEQGEPFSVMALEIGQAFHAEAKRTGFSSQPFVSSSLLSFYGKCGAMVEAEFIFDRLVHRNVVPWNAMLSLYLENNQGEKAWELYKQMQRAGASLNEVTLATILQVCNETGSLELCRQVHFSFVSVGYDLSPQRATTLVYAYGNCASMEDAQAVFDGLPQPDAISWNALCTGYAREGNHATCLRVSQQMPLAGKKPDQVTLLSLLSVCNHAGLVDKCHDYFRFITTGYGIVPDLRHYVSLIDLVGRIGDFVKLKILLWELPFQLDLSIWQCVLRACQTHGNMELGKQAFDSAVLLQPKEASTYVLISNIYADSDPKFVDFGQEECSWRGVVHSWSIEEDAHDEFLDSIM